MTIEQALRYLAKRQLSLRFSLRDGLLWISVKLPERMVATSAPAESLAASQFSVVTWKIVTLVQQLQRSEIVGNVKRRFLELVSHSDNLPNRVATLADLRDLAAIIDDELAKLNPRQDARGLVDDYGQTETKDAPPRRLD